MQSVSSRIWTRVAVSISYDDNDYTTGTSTRWYHSRESGTECDGNEGILGIPQSSSITGASPSDRFVSYPGHSLGESYPSAEMQSVYSTAPVDKAKGKKRKVISLRLG